MKHILMIILVFMVSATVFSMTGVEDIQTFTLENGMKFLVLKDHDIPNANMYIFWKVGSRNEYPGITGLSHFFEHMMFNGAEKYGPKEFDRVMEAAGGSNNAYTTENVTVYTDWFPTSSMEVIFDLEADRIGHLALDDQMVESERGVVLAERITGGPLIDMLPLSTPLVKPTGTLRTLSFLNLKLLPEKRRDPKTTITVPIMIFRKSPGSIRRRKVPRGRPKIAPMRMGVILLNCIPDLASTARIPFITSPFRRAAGTTILGSISSTRTGTITSPDPKPTSP